MKDLRNKLIKKILVYISFAVFLLSIVGNVNALSDQQQLGKDLFFDTNLSTPTGEVCGTCHPSDTAFAFTESGRSVAQGSLKNRYGNRNVPSNQYSSFSPDFHFDKILGKYVGGQFRDGRATNLTEQALAPFLNKLEMNDPNRLVVIEKIRQAEYADLFKKVYGPNSLDLTNVDAAYHQMAEAIAAFESSNELNKFTSKFDYYLQGKASLTPQEERGLELFRNPNNTCDTCHHSDVGPFADKPLFTDFTYGNPGFPNNTGMFGNNTPALKLYYPFYFLPKAFNPDGINFVDLGLGGVLKKAGDPPEIYKPQLGKFKVPSLRNVAVTGPYTHNGALKSLKDVVHFYNTRDTLGNCAKRTDPIPGKNCWPIPEVNDTKNPLIGHLGLSDQDENDIVAFLNTLTDGYVP